LLRIGGLFKVNARTASLLQVHDLQEAGLEQVHEVANALDLHEGLFWNQQIKEDFLELRPVRHTYFLIRSPFKVNAILRQEVTE